MPDSPVLLHDRRDGYHILTLNRPERLNAFTEAVHLALKAALDECESDDGCRAIVITGAGRAFSAGQDLTDRDPRITGDRPDLGHTLETHYNPLILRLRALPKPVIVAVNGVAAGAGANIALAGDIVIAARSASFIQAFAKIALIPDAGGTWWLTRHLGEARAKALALTAEPLPAETAAAWGLIWKAVDDDKLMAEVTGLAERFARGPTQAYALTKQAIHAASANALEAQLTVERELQREAGFQGDFKEGVAAFLERRPANFRGR
jgi:2-(1,2-epoxy-1,2-dihydrophenyl)acetyl-CoA isomerase